MRHDHVRFPEAGGRAIADSRFQDKEPQKRKRRSAERELHATLSSLNNASTKSPNSRLFPSLLWWLTTAVWAGLMFYFSTSTFGGALTAWLLQQVLSWAHLNLAPDAFAFLHFLLRKLAHLTEYAMFAILLYGSLSGGKGFAWRPRTALRCMALAVAYSLTDELHQAFVPGRGASLADCGIDTAGTALAMLLLYAGHRFVQMRASRRAARNESAAER